MSLDESLNNGSNNAGSDSDLNQDSDRDQLSDGDEEFVGTDPNNPDSDGDGITDGFEDQNGYDPLSSFSSPLGSSGVSTLSGQTLAVFPGVDSDGDGLSDQFETQRGLSVFETDSDQDSRLDGHEVLNQSNPLVADEGTLADQDQDGVSDQVEFSFRTNPQSSDSDRDGLNDPLEILLGFDPLDPDTDRDGIIDGAEGTEAEYFSSESSDRTFSFDDV